MEDIGEIHSGVDFIHNKLSLSTSYPQLSTDHEKVGGDLSVENIGMNDQGPDLSEYGGWAGRIKKSWDSLSAETRAELLSTVSLLPSGVKDWRGLMEAALEHAQVAAGDRKKIAIVGPANVGKSTLYNQLIQTSEDKAAVSAVAGTTRSPQIGEGGLFVIIDTPGVDAHGTLGAEEKELALSAARGADVLVLMFDGSHGIRDPEFGIYKEYRSLGKPMVVAMNKMDLVGDERAKITTQSAEILGLTVDEIIPMSAKKGWGISPVLVAAAKVEPQIVAALGRALPAYRWDLTQLRIGRAASTAAAIAITPLPFIHFLPLVGVQTALVLSIARIYDQRITMARAKEILAAFGLGFLGRSLFYELTKFGGPPAWAISAAVAAGTTAALGYAVAVWFDQDRKISNRSLREISKAISDSVLGRLKRFGRRRPGEKSLQDAIAESLREQEPDMEALPIVDAED